MRKKHTYMAKHLAHAKPEGKKGLERIASLVQEAKAIQWETDVLMVMDALEMGGEPFDRGEFLRLIDKQFQEDETCRSGDAPTDV